MGQTQAEGAVINHTQNCKGLKPQRCASTESYLSIDSTAIIGWQCVLPVRVATRLGPQSSHCGKCCPEGMCTHNSPTRTNHMAPPKHKGIRKYNTIIRPESSQPEIFGDQHWWPNEHTHTHTHWWPLMTIALDFKGFQKCNTIDDFWKHYAESEKLDFKSHILFDLIYMTSGKRQDDRNRNQIRACQELEGQELTTKRNKGTIWSDENISWL